MQKLTDFKGQSEKNLPYVNPLKPSLPLKIYWFNKGILGNMTICKYCRDLVQYVLQITME